MDADVTGWTYPLAHRAAVAFLIYPEPSIHAWDPANEESVEGSEDGMLPERPLFNGGAFPVAHYLSDVPHPLPRLIEKQILLFS